MNPMINRDKARMREATRRETYAAIVAAVRDHNELALSRVVKGLYVFASSSTDGG